MTILVQAFSVGIFTVVGQGNFTNFAFADD